MPPKEEPTLQEVLVRVLDRRVPTGGAGERKTMTRRELVLEMLLRKAEEGHPRMVQLVLDLLGTARTPLRHDEPLFRPSDMAALYGEGNAAIRGDHK
jgi:hypothetical protein